MLGADTVVVCGEAILGKPASDAGRGGDAAALSGRTHKVITALPDQGRDVRSGVERNTVMFADLTPIAWACRHRQPRDKWCVSRRRRGSSSSPASTDRPRTSPAPVGRCAVRPRGAVDLGFSDGEADGDPAGATAVWPSPWPLPPPRRTFPSRMAARRRRWPASPRSCAPCSTGAGAGAVGAGTPHWPSPTTPCAAAGLMTLAQVRDAHVRREGLAHVLGFIRSAMRSCWRRSSRTATSRPDGRPMARPPRARRPWPDTGSARRSASPPARPGW